MDLMLLLKAWWKVLPGIVVGIIIAYPFGHWLGGHDARIKLAAAQEIAVANALAEQTTLLNRAATERLADARATADKQKELTDAVANLGDEKPTLRDVMLACARLRQQGVDLSNVSACRGLASSTQTPIKP